MAAQHFDDWQSDETRSSSRNSSYSSNTDFNSHHEVYKQPLRGHEHSWDQDLLEPIAIVGLALKFPGESNDPDAFWQMLVEKRCASATFPEDRINIDAFSGTNSNRANLIDTRQAHFVAEDFRAFDAEFFNVSPVEASAMHPQQRWLLETTYHALENAGIPMTSVVGTDTSVHVGCFTPDLTTTQWRDPESIPRYTATGSAAAILSNRLSWFFGLHGSSITIDTACSSSMVAVDLACDGLWSGKSRMAIVAGANLLLSPELNIVLSSMNMLSKDGRCYSFDHRANGYARGEGVAALILKPLSQALQDGDPIRALIRSVGSNQDGYTKGGITQPSKDMQVRLIRETYERAGLDMSVTQFFEAHGTGTFIGDPIEARAIGECFGSFRSPSEPMHVGTVKSNIGHLEGASGLAGIIKTILILEKGQIPPNCNFEVLNPTIDAELLRLNFPTENIPWPSNGIRRASVNSFGFGGTNAHVVLDDAFSYLHARGISANHVRSKQRCATSHTMTCHEQLCKSEYVEPTAQVSTEPELLIFSAANSNSLYQLADRYKHFLVERMDKPNSELLANLAHTLSSRRTSLKYKSYAVVDSLKSMRILPEVISQPLLGSSSPKNLGFVFTGQGAQWPRMGIELLAYPIFGQSIRRASECLAKLGCKWSILEELIKDESVSRIDDPEYSQTICTAVQLAVCDLLQHVGIKPSVVVGHSSGEIAAAYSAGHLSYDSALKVAYHRGVLAQSIRDNACQPHTMAAIGLSEDEVVTQISEFGQQTQAQLYDSRICISCINSPKNVTVSGPLEMIDLLVRYLNDKGIFARKLKVGVGYHSPQMSEIASNYRSCLGTLERGNPENETQMISSVTGSLVSAKATCSSEYWVQNMLFPVNFVEAMRIASQRKTGDTVVKKLDLSHQEEILTHGWLEIGPHKALKAYIQENLEQVNRESEVAYTSVLSRNRNDLQVFLEAVGYLHCHDFSIDLLAVNLGRSNRHPHILSNLPQYPFDHSVTHWDESSMSTGYRLRRYAPHPLLGSPSLEWNDLEPKWNFVIRNTELPWIEHHRVDGVLLYPAAGMLVMAIEAVRLLMEDRKPCGYEIKQAFFIAPLLISPSKPVEAQISLRKLETSTIASTYDFTLYARKSHNRWDKICTCTITADCNNPLQTVVGGGEAVSQSDRILQIHRDAVMSCKESVEQAELYRMLKEDLGLEYGSSFQALRSVRHDNNKKALAIVAPFTWISHDHGGMETSQHPVVHPTTLDSLFHLAFVALGCKLGTSSKTMVPTRIGRIWISSQGAGNSTACEIQAVMHSRMINKTISSSDLSVISTGDKELRIKMEDFEATTVMRSHANNDSTTVAKSTCFNVHHDLDLDMLDNNEIMLYCEEARDSQSGPIELSQKLDLLALSFADQALKQLRDSNRTPVAAYQHYVSEITRLLNDDLAALDTTKQKLRRQTRLDTTLLTSLTKELSTTKHGELIAQVGCNLSQILIEAADPLQIIFNDTQLLTEFYEEGYSTSSMFKVAARWLSALVHKSPNMKFLEIGAGTGATTMVILDILNRSNNMSHYENYTFTDISPSFLHRAEARFSSYPKIDYRVLDIEANLENQDFSQHDYDVVVAANVLHATRDLGKTLQNARALLKPGGKLILIEVTSTNAIRLPFIFGLLPGWWLSEDFRKDKTRGPCITEREWNDLIKSNGFSGIDIVFKDYMDSDCHYVSFMVATAVETVPFYSSQTTLKEVSSLAEESAIICPRSENHTKDTISRRSNLPTVVIMYNKSSSKQEALARCVHDALSPLVGQISYLELGEIATTSPADGSHYIVLYELEESIISNLDATSFQAIQMLLCSARSIVWVSKGGGCSPEVAYNGSVKGLFRVCQFENPQIDLVTLSLEDGSCQQQRCDNIVKVSRQTLHQLEKGVCEFEYVEINGRLHIPRLESQLQLDQHIFHRTAQPTVLHDFRSEIPLKLNVRRAGSLDSIEFIEDDSFYEPLKADEIEIEVQAAGVSHVDCMIALGTTNYDDVGIECAGVVTRVGSPDLDLHVGERVFLLSSGTSGVYKRFVRAKRSFAAKVPDSMSIQQAANFLVPSLTAYIGIVQVARLRNGQSILIHAAASGVGKAAVQIALSTGAQTFAIIDSAEMKQSLANDYGVQADHIFSTQDAAYVESIRLMSGGGVDVILNSILGSVPTALEGCLGPFGQLIGVANVHLNPRHDLPAHKPLSNASFTMIDLCKIIKEHSSLISSMISAVIPLFEQGRLRPLNLLRSYLLAELQQAIQHVQDNQSSGSTVIDLQESSVVPVVSASRSNYIFPENATYVIAGGFGGLGQSLARWLARYGAKNLLLLSRSGPSTEKALRLISDLTAGGVRVEYVLCDICDFDSLRMALAIHNLPPIRGVVQASMVLRDATFSKMCYEDWITSTRPKIQGSWNLHEALPSGMDFFILLSSLSGIVGNGGQANYAAGNTYQDSLAHHRRTLGEQATVIDLGVVLEEGFVAENKHVMDRLLRQGIFSPISQAELFAVFDYVCDPVRKLEESSPTQIVIGLELPANKSASDDLALQFHRPLFKCMRQISATTQPSHEAERSEAQDHQATFISTSDSHQAKIVAAEAFRAKVSTITGFPVEKIALDSRIDALGIDSLVAIELCNWLAREWKAKVAVFEILGGTSPLDVGAMVLKKSSLRQTT